MVMVEVPAPVILAPMAIRQLARSTTSGSRAALPITVVPRASVAAIIITWVAPTETFGKVYLAPIRPPLGAVALI
jgi:hypothetical protein